MSDWRPAAALLPGLVHFATERREFRPSTRVRRIRLFIPGLAKLRLTRLIVRPLKKSVLDNAQFRQSSQEDDDRDPRALLSGRQVHTRFENDPFWEMTFPAPASVGSIEVANLLGRGGAESYGLNVEIEDEKGRLWRWSNADERTLATRLAAFSTNADALVAALPSHGVAQSGVDNAAASLTAVIAAAARAIAASKAPPDSRNARVAAIGAVTAIVHAAPIDKAGLLRRAEPVLDALTERRAPAAGKKFQSCELDAVAMIAVSRLFAAQSLSRRDSSENSEFLRSAKTVAAIEALINSLFLEAGGDRANTPLMFRKHGLSGPSLLADIDGYLDALDAVCAGVRDHLGLECALCYGTLLGAVREGAFIAHDDDVDLAFPIVLDPRNAKRELARVCDTLTAAGLPTRDVNQIVLKVTAPGSGIEVDLFPVFVTSDTHVVMAMERMKLRPVLRASMLPLRPLTFYGRPFLGPADPEAFLADRYGKTWRTPIREISGGKGVVSD